MRVAAVQLNSNADKARNLASAEALVRAAAADGAELVGLPEKWNLLAAGEDLAAGAEPLDGPSLTAARGWGRTLGIHLLAGSISERVADGKKPFNTSVLIGPDGEDLAVYRKIHMFDVDAGGVAYRESAHENPAPTSSPRRSATSSPASRSVTTCASPSCTGSSPCAAPG